MSITSENKIANKQEGLMAPLTANTRVPDKRAASLSPGALSL